MTVKKHNCNSQRTPYSLFGIKDFNKGIYIVNLILFLVRGERPISGSTYFRHIWSLGVNFMQLWFFVLNRFLI